MVPSIRKENENIKQPRIKGLWGNLESRILDSDKFTTAGNSENFSTEEECLKFMYKTKSLSVTVTCLQ